MKREFVTYEQAVALKELGFDVQNYFGVYGLKGDLYNVHGGKFDAVDETHFIKAPLKQQVFRFFREKYDAHIHPDKLMPSVYIIRYGDWTSITYNTYEEAESACIDKLIELAKQ